jgi:hypothetical protein
MLTLEAVQMDKLPMDVHMVWMKVMKSLIADTKEIASNADKKQRTFFKTVSTNMYDLMKVSKSETPTYYQYSYGKPTGNKEAAVKKSLLWCFHVNLWFYC